MSYVCVNGRSSAHLSVESRCIKATTAAADRLHHRARQQPAFIHIRVICLRAGDDDDVGVGLESVE